MGSFRNQREGVYTMKALILATGKGRSFEDGDEADDGQDDEQA